MPSSNRNCRNRARRLLPLNQPRPPARLSSRRRSPPSHPGRAFRPRPRHQRHRLHPRRRRASAQARRRFCRLLARTDRCRPLRLFKRRDRLPRRRRASAQALRKFCRLPARTDHCQPLRLSKRRSRLPLLRPFPANRPPRQACRPLNPFRPNHRRHRDRCRPKWRNAHPRIPMWRSRPVAKSSRRAGCLATC